MKKSLNPISWLKAMMPETNREDEYLRIIQLLSEQLNIYIETSPRPKVTDTQRSRLGTLSRLIDRKTLHSLPCMVKVDTMLGWVRQLQRRKFHSQSDKSKGGRPNLEQIIRKEIIKLANAGCLTARRLEGELKKCNLEVSHESIRKILREEGFPSGSDNDSWAKFIKRQIHLMLCTDFFTIETGGLLPFTKARTHYVYFIMDMATRAVKIINMTEHPTQEWTVQQIRNHALEDDNLFAGKKYLIHDNGPQFKKDFCCILKSEGITTKAIMPYAPNMNAYAERFVRTIREECLNKFVFFNKAQLRRALSQFEEHYNTERPHQGIGNETITPWKHAENTGDIICDERLGGLLKSFRREAA